MIRALPVVLLLLCLLPSCTSSSTSREALYQGVDFDSFVFVAAIEPREAQQVQALLEANGIPNLIHGSVVDGVFVPPAKKAKAIALLKADSEKRKYYIKF